MNDSSTISALSCHFQLSTFWASLQPAELFLVRLASLSPPTRHVLSGCSAVVLIPPNHPPIPSLFFPFLFFSLFIQLKVLQCWLTQMRKSMKEIGVMNSGWSCVRGEWLSPNSAFVFSLSDTASLSHCCIYLCKRKSWLFWLIPCWVHRHKAFYFGCRHLFAHLCLQASREN